MLSVAIGLIRQTTGLFETAQVEYIAHALLATLHINLPDELLATGSTLQDIRHLQQQHIRQCIGKKGSETTDGL